MSINQVHIALERLSNLLRVEARECGAGGGLLPIQAELLHYLVQCNRYSDTVQGASDFVGQTKGTVSQSIKVLENRGLVRKQADKRDRRLVRLRVTAKGHRVLENLVPARFLVDALAAKPDAEISALAGQLKGLLLAAQKARGGKSFGACKTCRYHESFDHRFRCGLTGETLSEPDIERICREHEYPSHEIA